MIEKEIDLKLKQFKHNCLALVDTEEKLITIADRLRGEPKSLSIRGIEEAKYQRGTAIYKNNVCELLDKEETLIEKRNHIRFAINEVYELIENLNENELRIIDDYYWYGISINVMASMYSYSNRMMFYKFQELKKKIALSAMKNHV